MSLWGPDGVSPGLKSRPSLSGQRDHRPHDRPHGVAGLNIPAFVERRAANVRTGRSISVASLRMLRGLTPRRLAGTMLEWTLRRLGVDVETAEEMRRMASLDEFHSQLEERARGWTEQWFAEGVEQGIEQGIEQGRAEGVAAQRETPALPAPVTKDLVVHPSTPSTLI